MIFSEGVITYVMNTTRIKDAAQEYEDLRCSLIGNFFRAGVVALLFGPLLVQLRLLERCPTPQELINRMGLRPGECFHQGLNCTPGQAQRFSSA